MKSRFLSLIRPIRAYLMRWLRPASPRLLSRSLKPLSTKYGFDRGKPIDRYYIEQFLEAHKQDVKGVCLEVTDDSYIRRFGEARVARSEVLDINKKNKQATIYGDLRKVPQIPDRTFDCIILTHVLGMIDDMPSAVAQLYRILKPGGVLLFTGSCFSPALAGEQPYWRFTIPGVQYLFSQHFEPKKMTVRSYGNVLSGQGFWIGMSQEDLTLEELAYNDARFPCIIAMRAEK